jgi:hypothetical protein
MFRTFAIATILSLTAAAAQAESLESRIHTAAVKACAPEAAKALPASHYSAITEACVYRVSKGAIMNMQARALEKTKASTAGLSN